MGVALIDVILYKGKGGIPLADILSQSQIDALLKNIGNSGIEEEVKNEEPKIKSYDFRSPKKFTKEQLRIMDSLHENFGRLLSSYLSGVLRSSCSIEVLQIEEYRYYEFNNALPDNALISLVDIIPKNKNVSTATMLMDISPQIAYYMIDRLLGGSGEPVQINRDFSEIEVAIMTHESRKMVRYLEEAWKDYMDNECHLTSVETNSRLIQIYSPEDIVVVVALKVKIEKVEGAISICIPGMGLEEMMADFVSKYGRVTQRLTNETKESVRQQLIKRAVNNSSLKMVATLNDVKLNLSDILNLQVNDVIPLNKSIDSDITVKVDSVPWFSAKLGEVKDSKAVKLTGIAKR